MSSAELPSDAMRIKEILASMGVSEHEPRVINQLMDFVYRYSADVLQDAEAYAEHAGRPKGEVEMDDVMLAIQLNAATSFTSPLTQDVLQQLANERNKVPLPPLSKRHGLLLPPDEHCLTNPNYQIPKLEASPPPPAEAAAAKGLVTPVKAPHGDGKPTAGPVKMDTS